MSKESKASFTRSYNASHKSSIVQIKKKRAPANVEKDLFNPDIEEDKSVESANEADSDKNDVDVGEYIKLKSALYIIIVEVKQTKRKGNSKPNQNKSKQTKSKASKKK